MYGAQPFSKYEYKVGLLLRRVHAHLGLTEHWVFAKAGLWTMDLMLDWIMD